MAVVCRLYEILYPCTCNVVISCWKSRAYGFVICRDGTDMCFVPGSGWKHLDLKQYRISGLTAYVPVPAPRGAAGPRGALVPVRLDPLVPVPDTNQDEWASLLAHIHWSRFQTRTGTKGWSLVLVPETNRDQ